MNALLLMQVFPRTRLVILLVPLLVLVVFMTPNRLITDSLRRFMA